MHFAVLAKPPGKTLRNDADGGIRHQEWFDTHFLHAGEGTGCVVGVQCREHQVAGERGFHRDFCRFLVASFADENNIRVLSQERAKDARKVQADILMSLDLAEAGKIVFNRVFRRRNVDFR